MNGIELKTFNPVVFDDPVYCRNEDEDCAYLSPDNHNRAKCQMFPQTLDIHVNSEYFAFPLKCDECKEHWTRAYIKNQLEKINRAYFCSLLDAIDIKGLKNESNR